KYSEIKSSSGYTGAQVANKILQDNDIGKIQLGRTDIELGDHYNHRKGEMKLSRDVYYGKSIASIAVAAHECGHALQYKQNYFFIKVRNIVIPVTNFANRLFLPLLIFGLIASAVAVNNVFGLWFIYGSLILLGLSVLLNLVTLPVEFDASRRAMKVLRDDFGLSDEELYGVRKMLTAAALTYVASLAVSILYLLRFILIFFSEYINDK
ncbi:MAG: zinc metallopeptidase, partial [Christensenellales bacterium]